MKAKTFLWTLILSFSANARILSPLKDAKACLEWRTRVATWLGQKNVKIVGPAVEVSVTCSTDTSGTFGVIDYNLLKSRREKIADFPVDIECGDGQPPIRGATPEATASSSIHHSRSIASSSAGIVGSPCKSAQNAALRLQEELKSPEVTYVSQGATLLPALTGDSVCCGGHVTFYFTTCSTSGYLELCEKSCRPGACH